MKNQICSICNEKEGVLQPLNKWYCSTCYNGLSPTSHKLIKVLRMADQA